MPPKIWLVAPTRNQIRRATRRYLKAGGTIKRVPALEIPKGGVPARPMQSPKAVPNGFELFAPMDLYKKKAVAEKKARVGPIPPGGVDCPAACKTPAFKEPARIRFDKNGRYGRCLICGRSWTRGMLLAFKNAAR